MMAVFFGHKYDQIGCKQYQIVLPVAPGEVWDGNITKFT
jgi:hypothetical protein